jgi:hypothetical protein
MSVSSVLGKNICGKWLSTLIGLNIMRLIEHKIINIVLKSSVCLLFVHRPEFEILRRTAFRKLDVLPSSGSPVIELSSFCGTQQSSCLPPLS